MSNPINNGGPAFPLSGGIEQLDSRLPVHGMSLRDYFAAHAISGIVPCTGYATLKACKDAAEYAYSIADAMLKERDA